MSKTRALVASVLGVPALVGLALVVVYLRKFGTSFSADQAEWGQFGDYFGGVMNPIIGYITLLAASAAVYFSHRALEEARQQTRSNRVFELYRMWAAEDMHRTRMKAWRFLRDLGARTDGTGDVVYLGTFSESRHQDRQSYVDVTRVYVFLADVNAIWSTDLIDCELAQRLLGGDLQD